MATVNELELFSKSVYGGSNVSIPSGWIQLDIDGHGLYYTTSGFQSAVYYNATTNEIVISICGTNDLSDLENDFAILNSECSNQLDSVYKFYTDIIGGYIFHKLIILPQLYRFQDVAG